MAGAGSHLECYGRWQVSLLSLCEVPTCHEPAQRRAAAGSGSLHGQRSCGRISSASVSFLRGAALCACQAMEEPVSLFDKAIRQLEEEGLRPQFVPHPGLLCLSCWALALPALFAIPVTCVGGIRP